ncbi:hypothetical protein GCM10027056_02580 [Glaciibacter psychrotolerans]
MDEHDGATAENGVAVNRISDLPGRADVLGAFDERRKLIVHRGKDGQFGSTHATTTFQISRWSTLGRVKGSRFMRSGFIVNILFEFETFTRIRCRDSPSAVRDSPSAVRDSKG